MGIHKETKKAHAKYFKTSKRRQMDKILQSYGKQNLNLTG